MSLFEDGPEYKKRLATDYTLPKVTLKDIHAAVPKELWEKSTLKGLAWAARDTLLCTVFYFAATYIDPLAQALEASNINPRAVFTIKWSLWATYWWFQGLAGAALFLLGHDAGHGTLSENKLINHTIGFIAHTVIFNPYFSWRHTHNLHHKFNGSMERDEAYVPLTRSSFGMAPEKVMKPNDYQEILGETPLWTLCRMLVMQGLGWQWYLTLNVWGNPIYPLGTNHFLPSSPLFRKSDRLPVIISNVGMLAWAAVLCRWIYVTSFTTYIKYYFIPYILTNHWSVMFSFIQHTDPTIPHFRGETWTFLRGAAGTIDRPLLGWMGRFFLHNVAHDHVAHHFFSTVPFWNVPELSKHVRKALGDDYNCDSGSSLRAYYRTFTQCLFVEDEGDIVFYKNKQGKRVRKAAGEAEL
ncbi:hypothetical protein BS47DRAFT_1373161 [Hydnum rufescens UP504]|uniref:Fatty acid desaturase domain-containing protein n=1 Tax=Hydnum rufescens UP504 TaxID=1448309 RepID=A0A9P6DRE5_9AGAM|nr:hypothetical protein BS47DRAFT_1373161 [Hydnum rufescens UP504]